MTTGFRLDSSGLVLRNQAGEVIFDTANSIEAVLQRETGTLALPSRSYDGASGSPHTYDHIIASAATGGERIRGWIQFENATDFQPAERPHSFGGSVAIYGAAYKDSIAGQLVYCIRVLSPVISGGSVIIREQYWNVDDVNPPRTLPAVDVKYDLRVSRALGGI